MLTINQFNISNAYQVSSIKNHNVDHTTIITCEQIADGVPEIIRKMTPTRVHTIPDIKPKTIIDKINDACNGYDKKLKAFTMQCCGS
jgi:hypothetical protein